MSDVQEYEAIFNHRGNSYAAAMEKYPAARASEFENLFRHVDLGEVRTVADVPSGSGYLTTYLPASVTVDAYDPTVSFREHGVAIFPIDLGCPRLARRDYDLIVSLASLHHVEDKRGFFRSLAEHVRPGGKIILADIAASSRLVDFLDGFIGLHNGTGHEGMYFSPDNPFDFGMDHERLADVRIETLPCPWHFEDRAAMVEFSTLLFGAATAGRKDAERAIVDCVGVTDGDASAVMAWELTYITATLS